MQKDLDTKFGFTLIEFLITVGILSIIAAFFIPQYTAYSKRQVLKTKGEELVTHIDAARNKALSGIQKPGEVVTAYTVMYFSTYDAVGTFQRYADGTYGSVAVEQMNISEELSIVWPATDPSFVVPTGRLEGNDRTITVCYDNIGQHLITIYATGVISISSRQPVGSCP